MLTRLRVSGFKNLMGVDVRFGPFTCIAGPNGVGKSNLFDAIRFLSALADRPLIDAALSVRDEMGRTADLRGLFHRVGDEYAPEMSFEAEMIIPKEGTDDLGQTAKATITFLRYSLTIGYRKDQNHGLLGSLEILREALVHINIGEAQRHLLFDHNCSKWRRSVVMGRRTGDFISTEQGESGRIIRLHQDGRGGRTLPRQAADLPRTVLSVTNAAESPTALLARREMQSWRLLQLEPSALRRPDEFSSPTKLGPDGAHLAATLHRLAHGEKDDGPDGVGSDQNGKLFGQVANRLAELIDDVHRIWVDRDERRELLTLYAAGKDRTAHAARALSDGTLRFLALAVLLHDAETQGVLCLEEPENGIHPERIPAMLELLQDIAVEVKEPVGKDNPLRQVIINTHSPAVVQQVPDDSVLVAELREFVESGQRFKGVQFSCLPDTWRAAKSASPGEAQTCSMGRLLSYLNPVVHEKPSDDRAPGEAGTGRRSSRSRRPLRVIDREDIKQLRLPFHEESR
ncbi:MAG: AAA family ATPase [Phycisphaerae bacterium]|nr:AAA family ATPase [Phycisphaerae bacterium]